MVRLEQDITANRENVRLPSDVAHVLLSAKWFMNPTCATTASTRSVSMELRGRYVETAPGSVRNLVSPAELTTVEPTRVFVFG